MGDNTNTQVLIAGAVAAFTVDLLVYPLDTIKTRYQSQDFRNVFVQTAGTQGKQASMQLFKGLYQGIGSVIFATLPAAGLFFLTYESAKSALRSEMPPTVPQPLIHAIASATAEMASCVVLAPAEVIKQNAQMLRRSGLRSEHRSTSIQALQMVWRGSAGPGRNLWNGYTALVARNLPFTALHFPLFEYFRARLGDWRCRNHAPGRDNDTVLSLDDRVARAGATSKKVQDRKTKSEDGTPILEVGLVAGLSAAFSSALASLATTPADVIKTRIMLLAGDSSASRGSAGGPGVNKARTGGLAVAKAIIGEKGLRGLFRGGMLRATWAALGGGLYLGSYEAAKVSLNSRPDDGF